MFSICFGCSKQPSHWDGSFEYPQHMFRLRNKKLFFCYALLTKGLDKILVLILIQTVWHSDTWVVISGTSSKKSPENFVPSTHPGTGNRKKQKQKKKTENILNRKKRTVNPFLNYSKRRPKIGFQDRLSLNAGQKYCRMLSEHAAILSTFIKLPFVFKKFVLSIFDWPLKTGYTVGLNELINFYS